MSILQTDPGQSAGTPRTQADLKLEVVVLPVSDVDRAKGFYETLGWRLDADFAGPDGLRVVQLTPPGSPASIIVGDGITEAAPGSVRELQLVVADVDAARAELSERGVVVSDVFHDRHGVFHHAGGDERVTGPDPQRRSYGSFASFADPDGNTWVLQEVTVRAPGRVEAAEPTVSNLDLDLGSQAAPDRAGASATVTLYLIRGLVAVAWAFGFAGVADSLTTGTAVLLAAYPAIDVVASLLDRASSSRTVLRFNAVTSALAAVGLALAATGDVVDVLYVFGAWAVVSGAAQLVVALRRRGPASGGQWPMLIAGGLSVLVGVYYVAVVAVDDPRLDPLAVYAAGGGGWFILQSGLLALRRRQGRS